MKTFTPLLALVFLIATGCNQLDKPVSSSANTSKPGFNQSIQPYHSEASLNEIMKIISEHKSKLSQSTKNPVIASATDIVVPDDYSSIQEAVDAAAPDTRIRVTAGTYNENIVVLTDDLDIVADGNVTINGGFIISADNITINGFTVHITNQLPGIRFNSSEGGYVKNNTVYGGRGGIVFYQSNNCTAKNNITYNNNWGLVIVAGDNNSIKNNTSYNNTIQGISLENLSSDGSENNEVWGNNCYSNGGGIQVLYSSNNLIKVNICEQNSYYGISLFTSNYIAVEENRSLDNGYYDIVNSDGTNNTFTNNNAVTTYGL